MRVTVRDFDANTSGVAYMQTGQRCFHGEPVRERGGGGRAAWHAEACRKKFERLELGVYVRAG